MKTVGAFDAKTRLSQLLDEVEGGAEVTIQRRGKPIAKLVPLSDLGERKKQIGLLYQELLALRATAKTAPKNSRASLRELIEAGRKY